jgi:SAM-dependent methyltransferase
VAESSLAAAARAYYGGRDVASAVREALRSAHGERDRFTPAELAGLDQLHTWGPAGTQRLAQVAGVRAEDRVLDLGGGLGGAARQLAAATGCRVTLVDLTPELCGAAELLNRLTGLDDRVDVLCGDVLDPPVDRGAFDVAWMQHVTMHIPDTGRLMASVRLALAPAGRLALWEVTAGPGGPPHLPAPWGDRPEGQHLASADDLCAAAEAVGLRRVVWQDLSADLVVRMRAAAAAGLRPPGPGFEVFLPDWADRQDNHLRNLAEDRVRLVLGVFALPSDDAA